MTRVLRTIIALALLAAAAHAAEPLRVGTVTVRSLDIYDASEADRGWLYRAADRLHYETRESEIRKFLLFREGDVFSPERLAETERNLRALHFLKSASVTQSVPHDGVVDVTVTTQDAWSIAPETQAGSRGGESSFGANLTDSNFLGYGKELSLGWDKNADRTGTSLDYQDPAFFAPYWNAHFAYAVNSDGYNRRATIRRPFYSFATPWAVDFSFVGMRQNDRLFENAVMSEKFQQRHRRLTVAFGRALTNSDERANRLTAGVRFVRDDFATIEERPDDRLPSARDFRFAFLRFDHSENEFVKMNFVNKDLRYEDFQLGRQYSMESGVSTRLLGAEETTGFVRVAAADGFHLTPNSFVVPSFALESRMHAGFENAIASANALYVRRSEGEHPSALVGRATFVHGWNLDREVQFFADGNTGLRGYRVHAFSGSKAMVLNLEQRFHLGREIFQIASPGLVVFADAGNAGERLSDVLRLKADVGVGIRIGLPRTPKNLLRFDVAYPLQRDPRGRRGLLVSVSSGQAF